jgi:hypothetical protein
VNDMASGKQHKASSSLFIRNIPLMRNGETLTLRIQAGNLNRVRIVDLPTSCLPV